MHHSRPLSNLLDRPVLGHIQLNLEVLLYILLGTLAFAACFSILGVRGQSHDECVHFLYSRELYVGDGFVYDPWRHGPFLYYANALMYYLFGVNDWTARLVPALFGVILVLLPAFLRKELGRVGALFTSGLTLISPSTLYYARYLRNDIYMMVWTLLMAIALFRFLDTRKPGWLYLGAAAITMALSTKETAYIAGYIGFAFVAMLALRQVLSARGSQVVSIVAVTVLLLLIVAGVGLGAYAGTLPEPSPDTDIPVVGLSRKQVEQIQEVALLGMGLLLTALCCWALLARDEAFRPALILLVSYVTAMGSLIMLGAGTAGLAWLAISGPVRAIARPAWSVLLQFLTLSLGACAGGYAWWRLYVRAREQGRLPAEFDQGVMFTALGLAAGLFTVLYTTFFTNPEGLITGTVGGLRYWLSQQEVKRAGQPWYYYGILVTLYEFLPLGLSLLSIPFYVLTRKGARARTQRGWAGPFVPYLIYWCLSAWLIYSWAGEKMPWMMIHIVQPMLLLGGRFVDDVLRGVRWRGMRARGGGRAAWRMAFLSLLVIAGLFTVRYSWLANYVNYDTAREFLVYSHGTPDLKYTVRELQALSRRLYGDETAIRFAYTDDASWPFECYMEPNFPERTFIGTEPTRANTNLPVLIVGAKEIDKTEEFLDDRYYRYDRKYLWFPHQDYYMNLSLALPSEESRQPDVNYLLLDMLDPGKRRAFLDVVFYRRYQQSLADWEPSNPGKFALYLRKDLVAQIWDRAAGPEPPAPASNKDAPPALP